mgnify:CR=1 FL=1
MHKREGSCREGDFDRHDNKDGVGECQVGAEEVSVSKDVEQL